MPIPMLITKFLHQDLQVVFEMSRQNSRNNVAPKFKEMLDIQ